MSLYTALAYRGSVILAKGFADFVADSEPHFAKARIGQPPRLQL